VPTEEEIEELNAKAEEAGAAFREFEASAPLRMRELAEAMINASNRLSGARAQVSNCRERIAELTRSAPRVFDFVEVPAAKATHDAPVSIGELPKTNRPEPTYGEMLAREGNSVTNGLQQ
jgi:hypothetical protein